MTDPNPEKQAIINQVARDYLKHLVDRIEAENLPEAVHLLKDLVAEEPPMQTERLQ